MTEKCKLTVTVIVTEKINQLMIEKSEQLKKTLAIVRFHMAIVHVITDQLMSSVRHQEQRLAPSLSTLNLWPTWQLQPASHITRTMDWTFGCHRKPNSAYLLHLPRTCCVPSFSVVCRTGFLSVWGFDEWEEEPADEEAREPGIS